MFEKCYADDFMDSVILLRKYHNHPNDDPAKYKIKIVYEPDDFIEELKNIDVPDKVTSIDPSLKDRFNDMVDKLIVSIKEDYNIIYHKDCEKAINDIHELKNIISSDKLNPREFINKFINKLLKLKQFIDYLCGRTIDNPYDDSSDDKSVIRDHISSAISDIKSIEIPDGNVVITESGKDYLCKIIDESYNNIKEYDGIDDSIKNKIISIFNIDKLKDILNKDTLNTRQFINKLIKKFEMISKVIDGTYSFEEHKEDVKETSSETQPEEKKETSSENNPEEKKAVEVKDCYSPETFAPFINAGIPEEIVNSNKEMFSKLASSKLWISVENMLKDNPGVKLNVYTDGNCAIVYDVLIEPILYVKMTPSFSVTKGTGYSMFKVKYDKNNKVNPFIINPVPKFQPNTVNG